MYNPIEIINAGKESIKANITILAKDYKEKTGRIVCTTCPSDIDYMISTLKFMYKMTQFQLKRERAQYKIKKGDKQVISNDTLTDELAYKFLKANPERITLFSKYPKDWEEVLKSGVKSTTKKVKSLKVPVTAEPAKEVTKDSDEDIDDDAMHDAIEEAVKAAKEAAGSVEDNTEDCDDCPDDEPCEECKEKKRKELSEMKLTELREAYPEIKATSKADFIEKVVNG